ncbi:natural product biosynthesis luciferase-like monooxygenase protein [Actinocorallia herbida]|uniref:Natural product biosynthesis luciferase-like monooxygenase protein n=1 Tax=Actinocorallia herbida TaxID=58109 RepID=A0A3N1D0J4_9ACTN|nr:LLM class flavin-dependent oxidoreductase [Actinocorallia herbida]ROO87039.1 natural product biosynthesis luciferase-like monooxygenase protein [Actinocorallia herbida]
MDFSLFYFADTGIAAQHRYQLLIEGAKFADTHGFSAVWTPERHFHSFGGLYPNPSVTSAAVAAVTERVGVRAGSVVAPLHHPVRIAEEWSVVDNLSGGRAGIAFASGWNAVDFALRPENFSDSKRVLGETVEAVRRLWRQEELEFVDGAGGTSAVRIFPPPIQPELPVWLTSAGSIETFRKAGELGVGVLTHLLGQDLDDLAGKIGVYRETHAEHHGGPGHVALMLHTYIGTDRDEVRELVRAPFSTYLRSSLGLFKRAIGADMPGIDLERLTPADLDFLVARAFDRYFDTGGLFGTVSDALKTVKTLKDIGVDDLACLVDFGIDTETALDGLGRLDEVRRIQH